MRFSALLASTLTLLTSTSARITGFSAPATVVPGAPISILIRAENYIQPVQDIAIAFGITPAAEHRPRSLGSFMGEQSIGIGKPRCSRIVQTSMKRADSILLVNRELQHRRQHHSQRHGPYQQT